MRPAKERGGLGGRGQPRSALWVRPAVASSKVPGGGSAPPPEGPPGKAEPSRAKSRLLPNMPKLVIPSSATKFPPEITVTPPTPTLLSPKGSISEETKQKLKVMAGLGGPQVGDVGAGGDWATADPCPPARRSRPSCRRSRLPRCGRRACASRRWRCWRRRARSPRWRARRTRTRTTWTSEGPPRPPPSSPNSAGPASFFMTC